MSAGVATAGAPPTTRPASGPALRKASATAAGGSPVEFTGAAAGGAARAIADDAEMAAAMHGEAFAGFPEWSDADVLAERWTSKTAFVDLDGPAALPPSLVDLVHGCVRAGEASTGAAAATMVAPLAQVYEYACATPPKQPVGVAATRPATAALDSEGGPAGQHTAALYASASAAVDIGASPTPVADSVPGVTPAHPRSAPPTSAAASTAGGRLAAALPGASRLYAANARLLDSETMRSILAALHLAIDHHRLARAAGSTDEPAPWDAIHPKGKDGLPAVSVHGRYFVKLYWLGAYRLVTVDDRIPIDALGQPLVLCSPQANELWVAILCKALLKLASLSFQPATVPALALESGDFEPLHALRGLFPERLDFAVPQLASNELACVDEWRQLFGGTLRRSFAPGPSLGGAPAGAASPVVPAATLPAAPGAQGKGAGGPNAKTAGGSTRAAGGASGSASAVSAAAAVAQTAATTGVTSPHRNSVSAASGTAASPATRSATHALVYTQIDDDTTPSWARIVDWRESAVPDATEETLGGSSATGSATALTPVPQIADPHVKLRFYLYSAGPRSPPAAAAPGTAAARTPSIAAAGAPAQPPPQQPGAPANRAKGATAPTAAPAPSHLPSSVSGSAALGPTSSSAVGGSQSALALSAAVLQVAADPLEPNERWVPLRTLMLRATPLTVLHDAALWKPLKRQHHVVDPTAPAGSLAATRPPQVFYQRDATREGIVYVTLMSHQSPLACDADSGRPRTLPSPSPCAVTICASDWRCATGAPLVRAVTSASRTVMFRLAPCFPAANPARAPPAFAVHVDSPSSYHLLVSTPDDNVQWDDELRYLTDVARVHVVDVEDAVPTLPGAVPATAPVAGAGAAKAVVTGANAIPAWFVLYKNIVRFSTPAVFRPVLYFPDNTPLAATLHVVDLRALRERIDRDVSDSATARPSGSSSDARPNAAAVATRALASQHKTPALLALSQFAAAEYSPSADGYLVVVEAFVRPGQSTGAPEVGPVAASVTAAPATPPAALGAAAGQMGSATSQQRLSYGRWKLRLIANQDALTVTVPNDGASGLRPQVAELEGLYAANRQRVLLRQVVRTREAPVNLVSLNLALSTPQLPVLLQLFENGVEIARSAGVGSASIIASLLKVDEDAAGSAGGASSGKDAGAAPAATTKASRAGSKAAAAAVKDTGAATAAAATTDAAAAAPGAASPDAAAARASRHRYIVQATLLEPELSRWQSEHAASGAGAPPVAAAATNEAAAANPAAKKAPGANTRRNTLAAGGGATGKSASGEELTPAARGPALHWRLKAFSSVGATVALSRDTEREDRLRQIKDAWETRQPGRSARAKELRDAFLRQLDAGQIKPVLVTGYPLANTSAAGTSPGSSPSDASPPQTRHPWDVVPRTAANGPVVPHVLSADERLERQRVRTEREETHKRLLTAAAEQRAALKQQYPRLRDQASEKLREIQQILQPHRVLDAARRDDYRAQSLKDLFAYRAELDAARQHDHTPFNAATGNGNFHGSELGLGNGNGAGDDSGDRGNRRRPVGNRR